MQDCGASLNSIFFFRFKPAKHIHKDFIFYLSRQSYHHNAVLTSLIKCFLLLESSNYIFFSWLHDLPFFVLVFYSVIPSIIYDFPSSFWSEETFSRSFYNEVYSTHIRLDSFQKTSVSLLRHIPSNIHWSPYEHYTLYLIHRMT